MGHVVENEAVLRRCGGGVRQKGKFCDVYGGTVLIWLASHFLVVLGVAMVGLAMLLVLQQRRSPQSAAAWLLFILLLPYLALPVFLALGFR